MSKCIHNEPARNCGICEDIHALQNLVESLKIEKSVLRTELKAWRSMPHLDHIIGTYWEHGEDYMDALTDAKQVTDTLGLLEDKQ